MLSEVNVAYESGRIAGEMFLWLILLAGILKCWLISRRPTTNAKCALALMLVLLAITLAAMDTLLAAVRERGSAALVLALDGISDPHNFGAILRSAAGAGVDGVVFPERRSAQVNETVMRASAGTAGRIPLVRVVNLARALEQLQEAGAWVYGLAGGEGSRDYLDEPFDRGTELVLGSEGEGLHQKIREHCDGLLGIGMPGGIESLNVSSAAAVMLFRVLAQRAGKPHTL